MITLSATFRDGQAFTASYRDYIAGGGIMLPLPRAIDVGTSVKLRIRFRDQQDAVILGGSVIGRLGRVKNGHWSTEIQISSLYENERQQLLAAATENRSQGRARNRQRFKRELAVSWQPSGGHQWHAGVVENIGAGGLFLRTRATPQNGAHVVLSLCRPGSSYGVPILGQVAWSENDRGAGISFECPTELTRQRLALTLRMLLPLDHNITLDEQPQR
jgi:Tfp pilus assembly protein PilZ